MGNFPITLNIEVCQRRESSLPSSAIEKQLNKYLEEQKELILNKVLPDAVLPLHLKYIRFCSDDGSRRVDLLNRSVQKFYHIYQTWEEGPQMDTFSEENEDVSAAVSWCLPNTAFEGLWESLILEDDIKRRLLSYAQTTLLYSDKQVNSQIVHWNGVVLLHGPPGTGKTSLCKALAQKLSIRLNSKYKTSQLIEINAHSLFSKWFSESAKLVLKMFNSIKQWLQSKDHFVCILMDEVESLTHVRRANGNDPSDSIRVVNAVLTQIDQLQRYPNFLILSTSNLTETIDLAFADRADLKVFIPNPSKWAIYEILKTCLEELIRCDLVSGSENEFFEVNVLQRICEDSDDSHDYSNGVVSEIIDNSKKLLDVSSRCVNFSGRTLRKIPFLTSAELIEIRGIPVMLFLDTMQGIVEKYRNETTEFFDRGSVERS